MKFFPKLVSSTLTWYKKENCVKLGEPETLYTKTDRHGYMFDHLIALTMGLCSVLSDTYGATGPVVLMQVKKWLKALIYLRRWPDLEWVGRPSETHAGIQ